MTLRDTLLTKYETTLQNNLYYRLRKCLIKHINAEKKVTLFTLLNFILRHFKFYYTQCVEHLSQGLKIVSIAMLNGKLGKQCVVCKKLFNAYFSENLTQLEFLSLHIYIM